MTTRGAVNASFAVETVRMFYPEPWSVAPTWVPQGGQLRRAFLLLPNASQPRLLVPARPGRVLSATMRRHTDGTGVAAQAKRLALGGLAVSGLAGAGWPAKVTASADRGTDSLERWLEHALGMPECHLAIRLGRPRANRKPVIALMDRTGEVQAYVKVGHNELSASLVEAEAKNLTQLASSPMPPVKVPQVLATGEWNGLHLLAIEPLRTASGEASDQLIHAAAAEIARSAPTYRIGWRDSPFRRRLVAEIGGCGARLRALHDVVAHLDETDPVIEFGGWHGDFNPGNFAAGENELLVWDWERYDRDIPIGFDLLHWQLQRDICVLGADPPSAASRLVDDAPALLGIAPARDIAAAYLAWLGCRYVRDGQDDAGASLGDVERWLLPALAGAR